MHESRRKYLEFSPRGEHVQIQCKWCRCNLDLSAMPLDANEFLPHVQTHIVKVYASLAVYVCFSDRHFPFFQQS